MKLDMHIHTIYSDGEFSPLEIVEKCKAKGISTLAITDHNVIAGAKEAIENNSYDNIRIIAGIEFSCQPKEKIGEVHILGYNIDLENEELNGITKAIMTENRDRIRANIEILKSDYGLTFSDDDINNIFTAVGNIGRPEIAKLMVKYGYVSTVRQAFLEYFDLIETRVPKRKVVITENSAINYIRDAGGIAVLAHPVTINKSYDELKEYIAYLKELGISGVEAYHSSNPPELTEYLIKVANELGLCYSCGSDFHGPLVTPQFTLGEANGRDFDSKRVTILEEIARLSKA